MKVSVMDGYWQGDLERWLAPFLAALRHKTRARMCPAYIEGLIGLGDRKSIQPMAERLGAASYDQLHHFIASSVWDAAPLEAALLSEADRQVGGNDAWLIIDDTALPKKGNHSVGVAPQYASALGKRANCQTLVSVTLASNEVPVMVGLRLFLPERWICDTARLDHARVPDDVRDYKPEIALAEIDRVRAAGVRFGCVLADAGYGLSAPFRQALSARGLTWAVGSPFKQKVYPADVKMIFPVAKRGRPRPRHIPDTNPIQSRSQRRPCWKPQSGGRSVGGAGPREPFRHALPLCGSGSRTVRLNASATWAPNTCQERRSGSSASTARAVSANTISPTFPPKRHSSNLPAPSRRAGSANRRTNSSKRNSVWITLKGDRGRGFTGTR